MPAPGSADTGTFTVPVGALSGIVKDGRKKRPVALSTRPGCETTSVGLLAPVRPVMSYLTGSVLPCTTAGTSGAGTLGRLPSVGPNVSGTTALATTLPSTDAV